MTRPGPGAPLCPSGRGEEGALLIGVVNPDRTVGYVRPAPTVDRAFLDAARERGRPESVYRFAQPCAESGCAYWDGGCEVARAAVAALPGERAMPRCAIRAECRWFGQEGPAACRSCALVITETA